MYPNRVLGDLTSVLADIWYVASFPWTVGRFLFGLLLQRLHRLILKIPLVQWILSPRHGSNFFSRFGRVMFASQGAYSFVGGGLAGLAILIVYFNVSLVRFDGTYYVEVGGASQVYAQELTVQNITFDPVEFNAKNGNDISYTENQMVIDSTVKAAYKAEAVVGVPSELKGNFVIPLHNPPRLMITTWYRAGHPGVDLATEIGTPIYSVADGVVVSTGSSIWQYGKVVTVDHGSGWRSMYAHMSRVDVKPGDHVSQSSVLGAVGSTGNSTGPHLHFELHHGDAAVNPKGVVVGI